MKTRLVFLPIIALTCITNLSQAQVQIGNNINGVGVGDRCGSSVSMPDAFTIAMSSPYNIGNGGNEGHVRVFTLSGNEWIQKGESIIGENPNDNSGASVSMPDANTVAIGSHNNSGNGDAAGHVRVYTWNETNWEQKGSDIDGFAAGENAGVSISMPNANTIAVGATGSSGINGDSDFCGTVRIYIWDGNNWVQKGNSIDGEALGDQSGWPISMPDENTVAMGSYRNSGNGYYAGHARVFEWDGGNWVQKGSDIDGENEGDLAGWAVSMPNANTIAVTSLGYHGSSSAVGLVRIFSWNGSNWEQKGNGIVGESADDQFGFSVSMPDENTVAAGSIFNDGNGDYSGQVRVFNWVSSEWVQYGNDIDGTAPSNFAGYAISMPDHTTVAVASPYNNDNGSEAGHVRVFSVCNTYAYLVLNECVSYTSPSGNYVWTENGVYSDTIANMLGCDSIITIDLTITPVDVSITNNSPSLTANASDALYQWLDCNNNYAPIEGAILQNYTATSNGNYAVQITYNNCTDTSDCIAISDVIIQPQYAAEQITIYPNPVYQSMWVKYPSEWGTIHYYIHNSTGIRIRSGTLQSENGKVDLTDIPPGLYLLHTDRNSFHKFVVTGQ